MKLRLWPLGIAALWYCTRALAAVEFVQMTDPHIFDGKGDVEGNKEALKWCIKEINGRFGPGANYRFVVVTGDLGLEGLPCAGNEKEPVPAVGDKAKELADIIKESKVKQWLFLPGNNDLVGENPAKIGTFHRFIEALKEKAPPEMQIVDFCPRDGDESSGVLDIDSCRFISFNNASFKSNDLAENAAAFEVEQRKNVDEVLARLGDPRFKSAYVFYHIPEIDDPYCISLDPKKPEDAEILKKRETDRGEIGKEFPCSAWTVTRAVRDKWDQVVANERVKGLFAGHFHSADEQSYLGLGWIRSAGYPGGSLLKLQVCPPVASKKQENKPTQARGFREVSVDCDSGKVTSNIFWYEKGRTAELVLAKEAPFFSIDLTANSATGLIYLTNRTDQEITPSLSVSDFTSGTTGLGLNTKTVLAGPLAANGQPQPIFETKIPARATVPIKVDISNFWEAGEATAKLLNFGEPIGTLRAAKLRPRFAVKVVCPTPDKPELTLTGGSASQITLSNEDAMTYDVDLSAEVGGIWSDSSTLRLPPNGSSSVELRTRPEWFPASTALKTCVRDGKLRIKWQVPDAKGQPVVERVIAFKAHLASRYEFTQTFLAYLFVVTFLILGGACSMLLSNWVPNRLSRAEVEEKLNDLARKTTGLSTRIDSGLRVFLRVERHRLRRLLQSRWIFSANYPDIVKTVNDQLAVLSRQIELAVQLDRAREELDPLLGGDPIPAKIDSIDRDLQTAADTLRRCDCSSADLDAAKLLIAGAADRLRKMDQEDKKFAQGLSQRIADLTTYVNPATETDALKELKALFPKLFANFDPTVATALKPGEYSPVDLLTAQLEILRKYQAFYETKPSPSFPRQDESVKYLPTNTLAGLQRARRFFSEIKEGVSLADIEKALGDGTAEIVVEPTPAEEQLSRFSVRFRSGIHNRATAREELRCEWDFGHGRPTGAPEGDNLKEIGWEAYHYFPRPSLSRKERFRRWFRQEKLQPETYTISATFCRKMPVDGQAREFKITKTVAVAEAPKNASDDRNLAEAVRLSIALGIALIGLLSGGQEKLSTLDVVPAAIAVFLLGFGADTIKNLISPKPAPIKTAAQS